LPNITGKARFLLPAMPPIHPPTGRQGMIQDA
jgi:hypothetical protein